MYRAEDDGVKDRLAHHVANAWSSDPEPGPKLGSRGAAVMNVMHSLGLHVEGDVFIKQLITGSIIGERIIQMLQ